MNDNHDAKGQFASGPSSSPKYATYKDRVNAETSKTIEQQLKKLKGPVIKPLPLPGSKYKFVSHVPGRGLHVKFKK